MIKEKEYTKAIAMQAIYYVFCKLYSILPTWYQHILEVFYI